MNSKYKNPYKKNYKLEIIDKINRDGITYGKLENSPFFTGSENLLADEIKINGEEPVFLSGNKDYFKIDENKNEIEIEINWKNRLLMMQENLGNALVRYFLSTNTNSEILNYKVEKNSSYIDIYAKDFKFMTVKNIESLVNYAIFSNLSIENFEGHIKIERLAEISYQGPALKRTGEIGMVFISSVDKINSAIRLTLVSGENAYKLARNSLNLLDNMKMYLNSDSIESVFSDVKKLKAKNFPDREKILVKEKNLHEEKLPKEDKKDEAPKNSELEKVKEKEKAKEKEIISDPEKVLEEVKNSEIKNSSDLEKDFVTDKNLKDSEKNKESEKVSQPQKIIEKAKKEKYDSKFFHEKYKLESFKDLNKKTQDKKDDGENNIEAPQKNIEIKDDKTSKNNLSPIKTKDSQEKSPLFYQAVDSFKRFSTEFSGINYIYKVLEDVNLKELREISNYILKEDNFIQIYGLKNGKRSKIILLRSMNLNFDLKKIYKKLQDHFDFTGTGNMYTLDLECREEDLTRIMESFLIEIRRDAK
ncbi:alanyl-tRNS synthetase [uncultured Peptoniphilus sp.]|uniref:alanyl-tRNS synthetase n=1 Tax=uncultured Peptoniphilus sp. TaxID=254354 RepID=UPI0026304906|nr:alanyl-tRNS synthetase [uncultured Peptoniphilus sp.]